MAGDNEAEQGPDDAEPVGRRAQRRAFRKDEILRTALDLVTEGGLDALTTTELAKRTGAALGALYRFYPSKQAVIAALQVRALEELGVDLERAAARAADPVAGASPAVRALAPLVAVADTFFDLPRTNPARYRLIDELLSRPDPVYNVDDAVAMEATVRPILVRVAELSQALPGLAAADVGRAPIVLWGALHGVAHFLKRDRIAESDGPRAADIAGMLVRTLLLGWGARPADVDQTIALLEPKALRFSR